MTKSNQVNDLSFRLHVEDQVGSLRCRSLQTQALAANSLQMLDLLVVCVMIYYTHGSLPGRSAASERVYLVYFQQFARF